MLENSVIGDYLSEGYLEILLSVDQIPHSLRVCVEVTSESDKHFFLQRAERRLPDLLAMVDKVLELANQEGLQRLSEYCSENSLTYSEPTLFGLWLKTDMSALFECGYVDDLDGYFVDVFCSPENCIRIKS